MPYYSYLCPNHHGSELILRITAKSIPKTRQCPLCPARAKRIFDIPTFQLNGWWPGKRIKEVDARKKRQADKLQKRGVDMWKLKRFVEKHSSYNPYTHDPSRTRSTQAQTEHFDDQINVTLGGGKKPQKRRR